mmetsp:Transcript_22697/g.66710  ORF Transcript_22697/g.66710 Transcript_22697/m.66710 type:complete len:200 (-) Transcript_22697:648-1247(-)
MTATFPQATTRTQVRIRSGGGGGSAPQGRHQSGGRARVSAAREGEEVAALPRAAQVVPQPPRRPKGDLLHGAVQPRRRGARRRTAELVRVRKRERKVDLDARDRGGGGRLARARYEARPEGADVRQRDCRDDHLHLVQALELRPLRDALAVHPRHRAAVEVQPPAVAALLVGVEVDAARLCGRAAHEIDPRLQLAELVV